MAMLGCLFDRLVELRLSRFICVEIVFQKPARSCFEVFAIKPDLAPPLTLLGSKPLKHHFTRSLERAKRTSRRHPAGCAPNMRPKTLGEQAAYWRCSCYFL